jgi:lipid II:glycine glycyltransferase (peptidoglycan interpeptide bridge formation enzyme)
LELAATEEDEILAKVIGHKTRNQILASYKRGNFNVSVGQDINEFYKIYLASIKRLKSIPKELEFFTDLEKSFKGNLQIIFAYHGSAPAGANLVLIKNKYLHLMFNVSNVEFFKDYVNDFLYWETIKFGLARGIEIFDFGPSSVRDKSHHHFKEGFGAKPVPIYNFTHYNSFDYRLRDFVFRKARNLRLKLNKLF